MAASYADKIRAAHRSRVQFDPTFGFDVAHDEKVVALAVAAHEGKEPKPCRHWHAAEEAGLCTDCDAAVAMELVELQEEEGG